MNQIRQRRKVSTADGSRTIRVGTRAKEEQSSESVIPVRLKTDGPHGSVTVGKKQTINLGNYESVQVFVSVTMPCDHGVTTYDEAAKAASAMACKFLQQETAPYQP